ncbi:MAG: sigma-70 family RNA polymerase sigma factor [Anaeroplasmataceae bacterium]|nr:sigma-70 family RNA polymerase sigma factor [Anaeroplasmataceae bacterium]
MEAKRIRELLIRVAEDDEKALEELFEGTKNQLYLVARDYLKEKSYAEDVLSIGFYKIYKKSKLYNEKYNGYNWMHEIIKNTAIDFNRKNRREKNVEEYDDTTYIKEEKERNKIEERIRKEEIEKALKVLDEEEYKVIYLRIWEKRTLSTIATTIKSSTTGVYRTYQEAIRKLREVLE